jgi:hypothetical protein
MTIQAIKTGTKEQQPQHENQTNVSMIIKKHQVIHHH